MCFVVCPCREKKKAVINVEEEEEEEEKEQEPREEAWMLEGKRERVREIGMGRLHLSLSKQEKGREIVCDSSVCPCFSVEEAACTHPPTHPPTHPATHPI